MHKLVALYHPPADPPHFVKHLVEVHLPIVRGFPGLLSLRYGVDVDSPSGAVPFAAVVECEFESEAAMQAALSSSAGLAAAADVPNYAAAGVTILTFPIHAMTQVRIEEASR
jgi:uncharacterized protein (TIGR02118 family)